MAFERGSEGVDPVLRSGGVQEERRLARAGHLGTGTIACPRCDAPVALPARQLTPAHPLGCPYCGHAGALREFLTLEAPSRPARVEVRVVPRGRPR